MNVEHVSILKMCRTWPLELHVVIFWKSSTICSSIFEMKFALINGVVNSRTEIGLSSFYMWETGKKFTVMYSLESEEFRYAAEKLG